MMLSKPVGSPVDWGFVMAVGKNEPFDPILSET
jgi:hypothetical protein